MAYIKPFVKQIRSLPRQCKSSASPKCSIHQIGASRISHHLVSNTHLRDVRASFASKRTSLTPTPASFSEDDALRFAIAQGDSIPQPPFAVYTCDLLLSHFEDKFSDLDAITIDHDNAIDVVTNALNRVIQDHKDTPYGTTSSSATSLTLLFFIERAMDYVLDNYVDLTIPVALLEIMSFMKFSDNEDESTLRMQHRALAARIIEMLNATFCQNRASLTFDVMDRCYQAWARAPLCLNMHSRQRSASYAAQQSLEMLNPYISNKVRPTAAQAVSLITSMATEYIRKGEQTGRPHSNDIQSLYSVIQYNVEKISCNDLEQVAGAVEHIRASYSRFFGDLHVVLLCAIVKECMRRKSLRLDPSQEIAAVLANCVHAVSDRSAGYGNDVVTVRNEIVKWKVYYRSNRVSSGSKMSKKKRRERKEGVVDE